MTLTLFFTGGVSLKSWAEEGNMDRDLEIYKQLAEELKTVNIVTYGGKEDRLYKKNIGNLNLLSVPWHINSKKTILRILTKYLPQILKTDILKTNQIFGAEIPLWFKKKFNKKLISRCGYLYSRNTKKAKKDEEIINYAIRLEREAFTSADLSVVSSSWQRDIVLKEYDIEPDKIKVIPNYVVTNVFKPYPEIMKKYDLVFVGRKEPEKNLCNLMKALHSLKIKGRNCSLLMIGGCSSNNEIREMASRYNLDVTFQGNVPNLKLPHFLNQAKIFILPSYYEGHPKALLEAMSCGLPCIGTDVAGIKEDIAHMKTGYLCATDLDSISQAIEVLLSEESLRKTIGKNAREYILNNYSINKILLMELKVIKELNDENSRNDKFNNN